jgi:hypothetical protein
MTTNYHIPHSGGDDLSATELNSVYSDLDTQITANASSNPVTTKGDLVTYDTSATRLAVGNNGEVLTADSSESEGIAWKPGPDWVAILQGHKATTVDGGGASATTWNIREITREASDVRGIVSIASNKFTPIAGTYLLQAHAPAYKVDKHRLGLWNDTDGSYVTNGKGPTSLANSSDAIVTTAHLAVIFTANGSDAYEIHHYTATARATDGLGVAADDGADEIYLEIILQMIDK